MVSEELVARLPLPVAQLVRNSLNAKTPLGRHQAAYYAWEAGLRLLAATCVVVRAAEGGDDPATPPPPRDLARPSLGHWWELVRFLLPPLAEGGAAGFPEARELVLGRAREDMPRTAGLDALLAEDLGQGSGARAQVRVAMLFDRLVQYRNRELGHGATGQRPREFYTRAGRALEAGVAELFSRLDPTVGRDPIYLDDIRRLPGGEWEAEQLLLRGETPRRLPARTFPENTPPGDLPRPGQVYVAAPGEALVALHPLVRFEAETSEVFFHNARKGRRTEYLCYSSGRTVLHEDRGGDRRPFLQRLLGTAEATSDATAYVEPPTTPQPEGPAEAARTDAQRIGEFEILSRLGQGGMGTVYRARQPSLNRQVALKCLSRLGDSKAEERFAREIVALGRVEHPNLVKIFTSGADGDRWFYAMELVEGATLARIYDRLHGTDPADVDEARWLQAVAEAGAAEREQESPLRDGGAVPTPRPVTSHDSTTGPHPSTVLARRGGVAHVVEVMRQVADALHHLHQANVVHRDMKPGNVMVTADGHHAVLMDLGLAQLMDDASGRLTKTHQFVGTLRYASPEQILSVERLDGRSDIYGLGATLWEMLTLRPLFGAGEHTSTPELIRMIQWDEPERPSAHNARVTPDLDAIVLKCLEKQPERRYATALDLAMDLRRWLDGEPVSAQPPTLRYFLGKYARKHKRAVIAAVAGFVVFLALVTAFIVRLRSERDLAEQTAEKEKRDREKIEQLKDQKEQELRRAQALRLMLRSRTLAEENPALGVLLAMEAARTSPDAEVAGAVVLGLENLRELRTLDGQTGPVEHLDVSAREDRALTGGGTAEALLWELPSGRVLHRLASGGPAVRAVAFDPTGRLAMTVATSGVVRVWDVQTGEQRREIALPRPRPVEEPTSTHSYAPDPEPPPLPRFDPSGRRLLYVPAEDPKAVRIEDLAGPSPPVDLRGAEDRVTAIDVSPAGALVAVGARDGQVKTYDATGRPVAITDLYPGYRVGDDPVRWIRFAAGGRRLITLIGSTVTAWKAAETGRRPDALTFPTSRYGMGEPRISADGRWILSMEDGDLHVHNLLGRDAKKLEGRSLSVSSACFTRDAKRVVVGTRGGAIHVIDLRDGKVLVTLRGHGGSVVALAPLADGLTLLSASEDGTARLWTLDEARVVPLRAPHADDAERLAASADGALVVTSRPPISAREASTNPTVGPGLNRQAEVWDLAGSPVLQSILEDTEDVTAMAVRPGRDEAVTLTRGGRAILWEVPTGKRLKVFEGNMDEATALAFHPTEPLLAVGCADGQTWIWNTETGDDHPPLSAHESQVHTVRFAPDGTRLLTATGRSAALWAKEKDWGLVKQLDHGEGDHAEILDAAIDPRSGRVATCADDGSARLWDARTGELLHELPSSQAALYRVAFDPEGTRLVTVGADGVLRVWDAVAGSLVVGVRVHGAAIFDAEFSSDGRALVTASADGTARVWDTSTWKVDRILSHAGAPVVSARFGPERVVATTTVDGAVRLWEADGRTRVLGGGDWPAAFEFSSRGARGVRATSLRARRLAQEAQRGEVRGAASVWDARSGALLFRVEGSTERAPVVAFAPKGDLVLLTDGGAVGTLLDVATWSARPTGLESGGDVTNARFSPDGRLVLGATSDAFLVWEAASGRLLHRLSSSDNGHLGAVSPDGKRLLTWEEEGRASIWDLATGKRVAGIPNPDAAYAKAGFSADGELLVAPVSGWLQFWRASTGEEAPPRIGEEALGAPIIVAAPSPRGDVMAVALEDRSVRILDLGTRKTIHVLTGQLSRPSQLAFSPDGRWLACACEDQTVHVWDPAKGIETAVFAGHAAQVEWMLFSPGGERLLSEDGSGVVWAWPTDVVGEARSHLPREMTSEERSRFGLEEAPAAGGR